MKTIQIIIITIAAVLLFTMAGCDKTDGKIELKEPKPELGKYDSGIRWTVNGPVDASGNAIELEEVK